MSKKKRLRPPSSRRRGSKSGVGVRRSASGDHWVLVHPPCVRERAEDIEEVRAMIAGGEPEIAMNELRWLLDGCNDLIEAHQLLGKLVLEINCDTTLARAHFGYAYELGLRALKRADMPSPLPARQPANLAFFEAGRGLAQCLDRLGKPDMASEVRESLIACDPEEENHK